MGGIHDATGGLPQSVAGDLLESASSSGSLAPITMVSGLFLLAAIPGFFLLSRGRFMALLFVGVGLALLPVVVLSVMDKLVVPLALGVGVLGFGCVLFFLGRLWDRWILRKKCVRVAESVLSSEYPSELKDGEVAELIKKITDKD